MSLPKRADLNQRLPDRYGSKGAALYMLVGGLLTIPVNGFVAYFSGLPPLFPSFSPTVLALFRQPLSEQGSPRTPYPSNSSRPRSGWSVLYAFGLADEPSIFREGVTLPHASRYGLGGVDAQSVDYASWKSF